ncbi:dihydroxy-acid dehydratase [Roseibium sp. AS2]|uniref:dihydroxy-acid dehydratase domain-containing protein n=1 Tax=Roseibium sp. AS2 TaxID=3135781 RepID=UPI00316BCE59
MDDYRSRYSAKSKSRSQEWFDNPNNPAMTALYQERYQNSDFMAEEPQSGTSESPSIRNASPEAAIGGGLALLKNGDTVRLGLNNRTLDTLVDEADWTARRENWSPPDLENQTPWQELCRANVGQFADGGCLEMATSYRKVRHMLPRDSH